MKQPTRYQIAYRAHMLRDSLRAAYLRAKHKQITARLAALERARKEQAA